MVYIINVYSQEIKGLIIKSFERECADEAYELETLYSVMGFPVSVEPDTFAYLEKYRAPVPLKRVRRSLPPAPLPALLPAS